jgi:hypothetical protein
MFIIFSPTLETMDIGFAVLNDILSQYKLISKNINFVFLKLCKVFLFWIKASNSAATYRWCNIPYNYIFLIMLTVLQHIMTVSVSCLFGHYPSSNLIKSQRFRDWLCLRLQVIKGKGRREVILAGGWNVVILLNWTMDNVQINKIQKCNTPSSISFRYIMTAFFLIWFGNYEIYTLDIWVWIFYSFPPCSHQERAIKGHTYYNCSNNS